MAQVQTQTAPTRRVRMIAPTYILGKVAEIGTDHNMKATQASEFVANGRAIYLDPTHRDVQSPPSTVFPDEELGGTAHSTLSLKGKSNAQ